MIFWHESSKLSFFSSFFSATKERELQQWNRAPPHRMRFIMEKYFHAFSYTHSSIKYIMRSWKFFFLLWCAVCHMSFSPTLWKEKKVISKRLGLVYLTRRHCGCLFKVFESSSDRPREREPHRGSDTLKLLATCVWRATVKELENAGNVIKLKWKWKIHKRKK